MKYLSKRRIRVCSLVYRDDVYLSLVYYVSLRLIRSDIE